MTHICFAGAEKTNDLLEQAGVENILVSYLYLTKDEVIEDLLKRFKFVIVDSGAHTLQHNKQGEIDYDLFISNYKKFIQRYKDRDNIFFVELDIDNVVGIEKVQQWRKELLEITNKIFIVWHKWTEDQLKRKIWEEYCEKYEYLGIPDKDLDNINISWAMNVANKHKRKVHGFAMTKPDYLRKYDFFSVDSTSWLMGQRFGVTYMFLGNKMMQFGKDEKKSRARFKYLIDKWGFDFDKINNDDNEEVTKLNIKAWLEFQKWLDNKNSTQSADSVLGSGYARSRANGLKNGKYADTLTILYCETCYIKERCEEYKANSLCGKHKMFQKMNIGRDVDKVRDALKDMLDSLSERISRATHFEAVDGGVIDKNIDSMKNSYARIAQVLWQIEHPTQVNVYEQTNVMNLQKIDIIKQVLDKMPDRSEAELEAVLQEKMKKKAQQMV